MPIHITDDVLNEINLNKYAHLINENDRSEFTNKHGIEHYKLLAYFSMQFNGANIIDIGTHRGSSALALSYNANNTVHSFDIFDKVSNEIKQTNNIKFYVDNIFDKLDQYKSLLLESPFIFLDIDPHEGSMEYGFYQWLIKENYQGILLLDDIWYFKEMRNNLWYKILPEHKKDTTKYGHWSGTGLVGFNIKEKVTTDSDFGPMDKSYTLVTAYFDLTKCVDASQPIKDRPSTHYLSHSYSTLSLDQNMVIYCDPENYEMIKDIRPNYLQSKTIYVVKSFEELPLTKYRNRISHPYHFDLRNTASYYLFCMARYSMLKEVIETNPFKSTHFAWINICIERMGFKNLIYLEEALNQFRDKFSTCYIDYIPEFIVRNYPEYFKFGRCSMCSGFFTGNAEYMNLL